MSTNAPDIEPVETREWLDSVDAVVEVDGRDRMSFLLDRVVDHAQDLGVHTIAGLQTPYVNTILPEDEPEMPGDQELEAAATALVRWNAVALVLQANAESTELGGHIASYQSAETLYEVGFDHFWRGRSGDHLGDLVYLQGHSSPGFYARAFLEGRFSEEEMHRFRQEIGGGGLSSYPHPWLMPHFWQFPTVSMGLGPLMGIYQARFMRYLAARGIVDDGDRKVWVFMGDGEADEPESMGAISLAGRERLDNLIFVVNCNLQRLDGPVRGNGKIIQELETNFRGAGWNVIKVIWGSNWDPLLAADDDGVLRKLMEECVDGEYQTFKANDGAYVRERFFGRYPETKAMVADWTDDEIWALRRGGHDPKKVYAAYRAAVRHTGQPTVILAKTIKGYGMGQAGEGRNITHQQKSMNEEARLAIRDRLGVPLTDEQATGAFFYRPPESSPELAHLLERREALGGSLPARHTDAEPLPTPGPFENVLEGSGERGNSTTMALVRILNTLVRDDVLGPRIVPIVPDESRTFGMEGMFRQLGIYSSVGQLYEPEDAGDFMFYREDQTGQILQEGINEAGAFSSWLAAATSYANYGTAMIPFYMFYSMFGFQRVGDLAWAAGDSRARGFLIGGTAGRTTLNGEGLQHEDGHSHVLASVIPNCVAYDPTYAYEVAVIVRDGLRRMMTEQEDVFYYITVMNENYPHPPLPEGAEEGILKGLYLLHEAQAEEGPRVQLLGSGAILREVEAAAELLAEDFGVKADVWSAPSFTELRRDGMEVERWNMLHPTETQRSPWVEECFAGREGPKVAATDYMRTFADQIRAWVPGRYVVLGADGFGRSDYRVKLRSFFEVDRYHVALAALKALADEGTIESKLVAEAIERYGIDTEPVPPWKR
ncbi:MAG: pyruvate dehydrogenase (acetyl-transferring), homodimeric type [Gaiella sp.]|nr:pyruvate dehydrogenase (acetyl-transferring), homodimeric type [Gaiella sp.]